MICKDVCNGPVVLSGAHSRGLLEPLDYSDRISRGSVVTIGVQ